MELSDQPFDAESLGDSEDADLVPVQSGEDWVAQLDDDLSRPASQAGELFRITALQLEDNTCVTVLGWIRSDTFPPWTEVKSLCPELQFCGITGLIYQLDGHKWSETETILSLSRIVVWGTFRPDQDVSLAESSLLLVGYV